MPAVSVIVPVLDEVDNVVYLVDELVPAVASLDAEIIVVDDGSTDGGGAEIQKHAAFEYVRIARAGKSAALREGLKRARGSTIAMIDADLQEDPRALPRMVELLERGHDCIAARRVMRNDPWFSKRLPSAALGYLVWLMFFRRFSDIACGLRVVRATTLRSIPWFDGAHRLLPLLIVRASGRVLEFPVSHRARRAGRSKYTSSRRFWSTLRNLIELRLNRYG